MNIQRLKGIVWLGSLVVGGFLGYYVYDFLQHREELAKEMDITPEKVLEIQQYAREPISLDQTIGDEGDSQRHPRELPAEAARDRIRLECELRRQGKRREHVGEPRGQEDGEQHVLDGIGVEDVHGERWSRGSCDEASLRIAERAPPRLLAES